LSLEGSLGQELEELGLNSGAYVDPSVVLTRCNCTQVLAGHKITELAVIAAFLVHTELVVKDRDDLLALWYVLVNYSQSFAPNVQKRSEAYGFESIFIVASNSRHCTSRVYTAYSCLGIKLSVHALKLNDLNSEDPGDS
jgi:hypothetical protein